MRRSVMTGAVLTVGTVLGVLTPRSWKHGSVGQRPPVRHEHHDV
jgi:hypothetical protein